MHFDSQAVIWQSPVSCLPGTSSFLLLFLFLPHLFVQNNWLADFQANKFSCQFSCSGDRKTEADPSSFCSRVIVADLACAQSPFWYNFPLVNQNKCSLFAPPHLYHCRRLRSKRPIHDKPTVFCVRSRHEVQRANSTVFRAHYGLRDAMRNPAMVGRAGSLSSGSSGRASGLNHSRFRSRVIPALAPSLLVFA